MERWDKRGVTEGWRQRGWRQRGWREAAGERESAKSDQSESRRILKQVNNLRHLFPPCHLVASNRLLGQRFIKQNQKISDSGIKRSTVEFNRGNMHINLKWHNSKTFLQRAGTS